VIEPPGDLWGRRVLEIHNRVLVAGEIGFVEQGSGAVQQSGEFEFHVTADSLAVEA